MQLGGVRLPAGRRCFGEERQQGPLIWVTDEYVEEPGPLFQSVETDARSRGLTALILDDLHRDGRPWMTDELGLGAIDQLVRREDWEVFKERWKMYVPIGSLPPGDRPAMEGLEATFSTAQIEEDEEETAMFLEQVAPWGVQFPGLALAQREAIPPEAIDTALEVAAPGRIGLVAVGRAADVPAHIGWLGATNHFVQGDGPELLSVMMRSWEDRFGARLLRLGFATMTFLVSRPPRSEASALAVAAEHYAFAGTDGFQAYSGPYVTSVLTLARTIQGSPHWRFWWD